MQWRRIIYTLFIPLEDDTIIQAEVEQKKEKPMSQKMFKVV